MESNHLKSKDNSDYLKGRQEDLETIFHFVNVKIPLMTKPEFLGLVHIYTYFAMAPQSSTPFQDFARKHYHYAADLGKGSSRERSMRRGPDAIAPSSR